MNDSNDPVTIGAYLIVRKIGAGGLGTVYEAAARRNSGEVSRGDRVAVKVVHEHLANDEQYRSLFDREGRVAQSLDAENVVRVLDYGEEDGRPYQVFEYLPFSVADLLREHGGMGAGQVRRLAADVTRGLAEASEKGIVHRDLSPGNILLTDQGNAKIADYGGANIHAHSSATGGTLGNPAYASPEHFGGAVDVRSDMYSLGLILYHALTGQPPFEASTPMEMKSLQESTPLPALPDTVPPELAAIVQRLTQKDPSARFQTPAELLVALQQTMTPAEGTARAAAIPAAIPAATPVAPPEDATQIAASPAAPPPAPAEDATQIVTAPAATPVVASPSPAVIEPTDEEQPAWRRTPVLAAIGAAAALLVVAVLVIALSGGDDAAPLAAVTPTAQPTLAGPTPSVAPTPEPSVALTMTPGVGGTLIVNDFGHGSLAVTAPAGTGVTALAYELLDIAAIEGGQAASTITFSPPIADPGGLLEALGGGVAISAFQLDATAAGDDATLNEGNPFLLEATFTSEALDLVDGARDRLVLLRFDVTTGEWEQVDCGPLNGTSDVVQCRATHLSPWIVAALVTAPVVETPTPTVTVTPPTVTVTPPPTVTVTPPPVAPPTNAVITCTPDPVLLNAELTCTVTVEGQANSFIWTADPGDPSVGAGPTFTTTFPTGIAGKGNLTVSVCNPGGCAQATYSVGLIFVEAPPPPTATAAGPEPTKEVVKPTAIPIPTLPPCIPTIFGCL